MPDNCCVPTCCKIGYRVKKVTYHGLPIKDQRGLKVCFTILKISTCGCSNSFVWYLLISLFQTWLVKIRRDVSPGFRITERTKICSLHFRPSDFHVSISGRRSLKDEAVPSIFSWSGVSTKRRSPCKKAICEQT